MGEHKNQLDLPSFISRDELSAKNKVTRTQSLASRGPINKVKATNSENAFSHSFSDGFDLGGIAHSISEVGSTNQDMNSFFTVLDPRKPGNKIRNKRILEEKEEPSTKRLRSTTPSFSVASQPALGMNSMPSFRYSDSNTSPRDGDDEYKEIVPWTEKYAPQNSSTVALHSRKLKEVQEVIESMCSGNPTVKLLILSGPAGSSKSSIFRTLAKETLIKVNKLKDLDLDLNNYLLEWENPDRMEGRSLTATFQEFLSSAKYKTNQNCMIMVDDIPNLSHQKTREMFNAALLEWINQENVHSYYNNPGLVLIITEIEVSSAGTIGEGASTSFRNSDSLITERVILDKVLKHRAVRRIKFRPVSKTISAKALKSIVSQERILFTRLSPRDITRAIDVMSNYGDIRSAIMSLEYWAIGRSRSLSSGAKKSKLEQDGEDIYLNMLRRDAHLDLFHAVGKVVHLSSKDKYSKQVSEDELVVEGILSDWATSRGDQQILSSTVFENYLPVNKYLPFEEINKCLQSLCESDILTANTFAYGGMGSKQCTEIACELDIRGVRGALQRSQRLKSGSSYTPLHFPRLLKKQTPEIRQLRLELDEFREKRLVQENAGGAWSYETLLLYEKYYSDAIYNSPKFQSKVQERIQKNEIEDSEEEGKELKAKGDTDTSVSESKWSSDFGSDLDAEIEDELDMMLQQQSMTENPPESISKPIPKSTETYSDDFFNDDDDDELANLI